MVIEGQRKGRYSTAAEALGRHVAGCARCRENVFGLCAAGFRMLGQAAGGLGQAGQLPLVPAEILGRPMVRIYLGKSRK